MIRHTINAGEFDKFCPLSKWVFNKTISKTNTIPKFQSISVDGAGSSLYIDTRMLRLFAEAIKRKTIGELFNGLLRPY